MIAGIWPSKTSIEKFDTYTEFLKKRHPHNRFILTQNYW